MGLYFCVRDIVYGFCWWWVTVGKWKIGSSEMNGMLWFKVIYWVSFVGDFGGIWGVLKSWLMGVRLWWGIKVWEVFIIRGFVGVGFERDVERNEWFWVEF